MSGLSVLAVDDEAPSLDELSYLLERSPLVGNVEVARSATQGLRRLHEGPLDVVFLDVRMPGLSGMELARVLGRFTEPPAVVFVTAHERHAVEAFEVGAADYLLKPVDAARLDAALRRAAAPRLERQPDVPDSIVVEAGSRTVLVGREEVTWIEAAGDYVRLHLRDGASYLLRTPMAVLEEWPGFVRVHRSYLVSISDIRELRAEGQHSSVSVAGHELPVSRRHLRDLHDRLVHHARPSGR